MPKICDTLAQLNETGDLTVKQLEDALGLAPRSGYPYLSRCVPDAQQLRQLFRAPLPPAQRLAVQKAILGYFADGTGWAAEFITSSADVNGDGDVNTSDVIDGCIRSLRSCAEALDAIRAGEKTGLSIEPEDARVLTGHLNMAISNAMGARRAVQFLAERRARFHASHSHG